MMNNRLSSGSPFEEKIGYSRAVVDENYIFISGTTGYDYDTMAISEDIAEQTHQCFKNIEHALQECGSSIQHIVRVVYILPNREEFEDTWPVLRAWLGEVKPAATMFEARLMNDEMKIEIQVTARR
ncbi:MAG: RidA family protein [Bacteroidota bacterium]